MKALLMAVIFLWSGQVIAGEECSQSLGTEAENAVDTMKSWSSIYSGFKKYKSCDDGGVAEGFTEAVVHLLASDWFFESGSAAGIQPHHSARLRMLLIALETSAFIEDMDVPGFRLHALKGKEKGRWSVWVNGNWRLTFEFHGQDAYVLDYEDYH
jgi:proteic killer suppression protein